MLLIGIASRPLGGALARGLPVRPIVMASLGMNIAGCLLLSRAGSSFAGIVGGIVLLGVGCGLPYAALFNRAAQLFPGRAGAAMGLVNMLGIVMILAGAPLVGMLTGWTGNFHAAFVSLAAFSAAVLLAAFFIRE